jgi:hypothetical protein
MCAANAVMMDPSLCNLGATCNDAEEWLDTQEKCLFK